ncbi:MAG: proton-conducting membrane transporter [Halodesulfurarchaeum sp.]
MTTKPELAEDIDVLPGIAAIALLAVLSAAIVAAQYGSAAGFPDGARITASIGHALFNFQGGSGIVRSEGFLAPFEIIDLVLVAALVVAVMLARREGRSILDRKRGGEQ